MATDPSTLSGQLETTALTGKDASRAIWGLVYLVVGAILAVLVYLVVEAVGQHNTVAGSYLNELLLALGLGGGGTDLLLTRSPLQK